jgi:hypothetical protein
MRGFWEMRFEEKVEDEVEDEVEAEDLRNYFFPRP